MSLEEFYNEHGFKIDRRAAKLTGKSLENPDTKDFIGDCWHKLVVEWDKWRPIGSRLNWAYTVVLNLKRDQARARKTRWAKCQEISVPEVFGQVDDLIADRIDAATLIGMLKEILTPELRDIVYLSLSGLTQEEIGAVLGQDQSGISRKLKEARRILHLDEL